MKKLFIVAFLILSIINIEAAESDFHNFTLTSANGEKFESKDFKGKSILVVNIATRCGYTDQLDDLEALYKKYQSKDFVILGIPSNDFGSQTPEDDQKIAKFCRLKYGVTFPITSKVVVNGPNKIPFMKSIIKSAGGNEIEWNFEKFLFDKNGNFVKRFSSATSPSNDSLRIAIEETLK